MSRRSIPGILFPAILFALAVLGGCAREEPSALRWRDLLVEDLLTSDRDAVPMEAAFCADESRWSRRLAAGEELSALFALGQGGRLVVAGCIGRPDRSQESGDVARSLELTLESFGRASGSPPAAREPLRRTLELPSYSSRWGEEIDLSALPPGPLRLRLKATLPEGQELYLRDLALRHAAAAPPPLPAFGPEARQILLISVDTLRPDALGALGGPWATPHLDRLAAQSEVWAPHYAASSWTKPSHASLLTGQSLHVHRAGGAEVPIHPGVPLLSERFRRAGFLTRGLVYDCTWLRPKFGFSRGFDEYSSVPWTLPQMVRSAADWMAAHRDQPFFFFFHTFEVHSDFRRLPYEAPGVRQRTVEERFGLPRYGCRQGRCASGLLLKIDAGEVAPLPGEAEVLRFLYGEGVQHLDEGLGQLFAELEELGLFDSMLIAFTADHGESFLEHGELLHGNPWNEVIRVPLLIKWPGGASAGERRTAPSSALDVAPTLLAAAGLPAEGLPGVDLRSSPRPRPVFSWDNSYTVATAEWKAVFEYQGGELLFDLANDPGEERNLAAADPERLATLRRMAEARLLADRQAFAELNRLVKAEGARALSEDEIQRLKALGYLGGT